MGDALQFIPRSAKGIYEEFEEAIGKLRLRGGVQLNKRVADTAL